LVGFLLKDVSSQQMTEHLKRLNPLPLVWATTRSGFGRSMIGETELRQWPNAVLAFHYGASAVRGRLADFDARVEGIET